MQDELQNKYAPEGAERIGFILSDDTVVECLNDHDDPEFGARYRSIDLFDFVYNPKTEVKAVATWHTHPNVSCNLSGEDYAAFKNHPHLAHYIIGSDGVAIYTILEGGVVKRG